MLDDECIDYEKLHRPCMTNVTEMGVLYVRLALVPFFIFLGTKAGLGTGHWFLESGTVPG